MGVVIPTKATPALALKLACIVVHAEELSGAGAHPYDATVIRALINDPEVAAWLDSFDQVLLPVQRSPKEVRT